MNALVSEQLIFAYFRKTNTVKRLKTELAYKGTQSYSEKFHGPRRNEYNIVIASKIKPIYIGFILFPVIYDFGFVGFTVICI